MDNGYCFSSHSLSPSTWPFFIFLTAVYSSHWYLEHWMHLCRDSIRKTSFPWKKCGSPVGSNHRPTWYSTSRCYFTGRLPLLFPLWLCESSRYTVLFISLWWWNYYRWEMRKQGSILWLWWRSHPSSFLKNFQIEIHWLYVFLKSFSHLIPKIAPLQRRYTLIELVSSLMNMKVEIVLVFILVWV